jgi:hypothetical protein
LLARNSFMPFLSRFVSTQTADGSHRRNRVRTRPAASLNRIAKSGAAAVMPMPSTEVSAEGHHPGEL